MVRCPSFTSARYSGGIVLTGNPSPTGLVNAAQPLAMMQTRSANANLFDGKANIVRPSCGLNGQLQAQDTQEIQVRRRWRTRRSIRRQHLQWRNRLNSWQRGGRP